VRLFQLPLAADAFASSRLVPGDRNVDEPLQEVSLGRLGRSPGVLQLLVGGEVVAAADQLEAAGVGVRGRP
jgi:hypothetical protein